MRASDTVGSIVPIVGVKTGGSRVGGPELCAQVRALSMEVIPYVLLD